MPTVYSETLDNLIMRDFSNVTSLKETMESIIEQYEKQIIRQFLLKNDYNKSKTARELAITRKTLAQKIEKYRL